MRSLEGYRDELLHYCAWVVGEALMDLIPTGGGPHRPIVGCGPANTSKTLARLGYDTYSIGGIRRVKSFLKSELLLRQDEL